MTAHVLIVDDEPGVRYTLRAILEEEGFAVSEAADGAAALEQLARSEIHLVLTDLRMPRMDGLTLLGQLRGLPHPPPTIVITAHGSERLAVEAMKLGAVDYFAKPFDPDEIVKVVHRQLQTVLLHAEVTRLRGQVALGKTMVFASEAMLRVAELVERAARRNVTVLITGESGTGKERVAEALVKASDRADQPFVRFNCAALPRELAEAELFGHTKGAFTGADRARQGLFREADGGTILLDEVGELDPLTQGALLRVLQEREVRPIGDDRALPVDVRIVCATNRDLAEQVREGNFREDLFYRLNVVLIHVPPLRERPEDIAPLAEHFVRRFADRFGLGGIALSPRVQTLLQGSPWRGNVRELENTIERLVALSEGEVIDDDPFGERAGSRPEPAGTLTLKERVALFEKGLIQAELTRCQGNQSEAARRLGVSRVTLIDKLKRYGLR